MKKISEKIWNFIDKNKIIIFLIIITILSLALRFSLFSYDFGDYDMFLKPWFEQIKEGGGLFALNQNIGNYNAPYITILALLTYLPFDSLISIKMVSLIFDYVCAVALAKIALHVLKENKNREKVALLLYSITIFLPTVFLNSSCWAQADSIYAAFVMISLLYLIKKKYTRAFIFLGIAFSFKLQFIFILPLYILIYISERKFSIFNFLILIISNIGMCLPSIIFGNSISNCFSVYINQAGTYSQYATLNFPNIYSIFFTSPPNLIVSNNSLIGTIGIIFTVFIFIIIAFLVLYKKVKFDSRAIIEFGLWSVMICTFFLPQMHDRYLYVGDLLAIAYLLFNRKKYYIAIGIELVSAYGYIHFLFSAFGLEMKLVGILYFVIIILYSKDMYKKYLSEKEVEEKTIQT